MSTLPYALLGPLHKLTHLILRQPYQILVGIQRWIRWLPCLWTVSSQTIQRDPCRRRLPRKWCCMWPHFSKQLPLCSIPPPLPFLAFKSLSEPPLGGILECIVGESLPFHFVWVSSCQFSAFSFLTIPIKHVFLTFLPVGILPELWEMMNLLFFLVYYELWCLFSFLSL